MSKRITISGRAIILPDDNIDTDRIIPARFLKCVTFDELGNHVFEDDRAAEMKAGKKHPFDDPKFNSASILFTGKNFGSGSSREHAVHALIKWGIRAIVYYGDYSVIFFSYALSNALPTVLVEKQVWREYLKRLEESVSQAASIDLDMMELTFGALKAPITFQQPSARENFIMGSWDKLGVLLRAENRIEETIAALPYK
jgi:3-isopropylmalate/(R)-2-methylmalate dehydratase small subunit